MGLEECRINKSRVVCLVKGRAGICVVYIGKWRFYVDVSGVGGILCRIKGSGSGCVV